MKRIATLTLIAGLLVGASTFTLTTPAQAHNRNFVRVERNIQRREALQAERAYYNNAYYNNAYYNNVNYANPYYNSQYCGNPSGLSFWQRVHAGLPL